MAIRSGRGVVGIQTDMVHMSTGSARQYYDLAVQQMNRQHTSIGRLTNKVSSLMGFGFVLLVLALNVLKDFDNWVIVVPIVVLFASLVLLIWAYRAKPWGNAPSIDWICWCKDYERNPARLLLDAVEAMKLKFNSNQNEMTRIGILLKWASLGLFVGSGITAFIVMGRLLL